MASFLAGYAIPPAVYGAICYMGLEHVWCITGMLNDVIMTGHLLCVMLTVRIICYNVFEIIFKHLFKNENFHGSSGFKRLKLFKHV